MKYFYTLLALVILFISCYYEVWNVSLPTERNNKCDVFMEYALTPRLFHPTTPSQDDEFIKDLLQLMIQHNGTFSEDSLRDSIIKRFGNCRNDSGLFQSLHLFLKSIYYSFYIHQHDIHYHNNTNNNTKVIIVGGGTVGLINALETIKTGAIPFLVEKQMNYTRNTWFDIYGGTWASSLSTLHQWGVLYQNLEGIMDDSGNVLSIRSQLLERALSRILYLLDVDMYYGYSFNGIIEDNGINVTSIISTDANEEVLLNFDFIIGADGGNSYVRKYFNIPYEPVKSFHINNEEIILEETISQIALVIRLSPLENGTCPLEATYPNSNDIIHPWHVGFKLPNSGVTQVFKRFFLNYCELQLFFDNDAGKKIIEDISKDKHWETILPIINECIQSSYNSISELRSSLESTSPEYRLVNVTIRKAETNILSLDSGIVILVGDASLTSHFRLGIGINAAFDQLLPLKSLLEVYSSGIDIESAIDSFKILSGKMYNENAEFEVLSILFEGYCDYLVFIDSEKDDSMGFLNSMLVYGKEYKVGDYNLDPFLNDDIILNCPYLKSKLH